MLRRHRHSPEVARVVGAAWAERLEPDNRLIDASPQEYAVVDARTPGMLRRGAPAAGEHQRDVLRDWGIAETT